MAGVKWILLLITFQGNIISVSKSIQIEHNIVIQEWTFPSTITALIGSCVEIPCTYRSARTSGTPVTVWYLYATVGYPEILNSGDSSSVMEKYRDRTSLVPGENSCTLRIDPVRGRDGDKYYYPGINEDKQTNAYDKQSRQVHLRVTDIPGKCDLHVPQILTEGEATIINCTAEHTCSSSPPSLQWNKPGQIQKMSVDISGGTWREESILTYIPSYLDDETPVQCTATYPNGRKTERQEILNIKYAPKNVTVTVEVMTEEMGIIDMMLLCKSFSNPAVDEYEWYRGKTKLPDRGRVIKVRNVTWDMEPHSCAAINHLGRGESTPTDIPIPYSPKNVTVTVIRMKELMEGIDVTLQCNSFSRPDINDYEWYKGKTKLPERGREITVRNVTWDMEPYYCAAINHLGRGESAPTEIPVQYEPKNVTVAINGTDEVMEGSDVTIQCNSFSNLVVYDYEWYKGKTKLPDRGREITVMDVTRDMELYSCAAINHLGRGESAPTKISVQYKVLSSTNIILLATTGAIFFLLLLALPAYFYWRKKFEKLTSNETEASPDATYTDLIKRDIENDYEQFKPENSAHHNRTHSCSDYGNLI